MCSDPDYDSLDMVQIAVSGPQTTPITLPTLETTSNKERKEKEKKKKEKEKEKKEKEKKEQERKEKTRTSGTPEAAANGSKRKWVIGAIVAAVVLAVGVGVGLAVGLLVGNNGVYVNLQRFPGQQWGNQDSQGPFRSF